MKVIQIQNFSINDGKGVRTTIFMMGCPLRCKWCSNPETWDLKIKEAEYKKTIYYCNSCGWQQKNGLVENCPICNELVKENEYVENKELGKDLSTKQIVDVIKRQLIFYRYSGGGVTFSGGEPTYQIAELRELVVELKKIGIHLSMESCGYFNFDKVKDVLSKLDHIFIDIKLMDTSKHMEYTKVDNSLILENIIRLKELAIPITIRVPAIEEVNMNNENIDELIDFIKSNFESYPIEIEFLPYHNLGKEKYDALSMREHYFEYTTPNKEKIDKIRDLFEKNGIKTVIY